MLIISGAVLSIVLLVASIEARPSSNDDLLEDESPGYLTEEDCPPGYTYVEEVQRCYWIRMSQDNWTESSEACRNSQGDLAKIYNEEQTAAILSLIETASYSDDGTPIRCISTTGAYGFWIGAKRVEDTCTSEFVWKYNDDWALVEPLTYTNFYPSEPNCAYGSEECISYLYLPDENYQSIAGMWNDCGCWDSLCSVCEYKKLG